MQTHSKLHMPWLAPERVSIDAPFLRSPSRSAPLRVVLRGLAVLHAARAEVLHRLQMRWLRGGLVALHLCTGTCAAHPEHSSNALKTMEYAEDLLQDADC